MEGTPLVKRTYGALVWRITRQTAPGAPHAAASINTAPFVVIRSQPWAAGMDEAKPLGRFVTLAEARAAMTADIRAHGFDPTGQGE